MKTLKIFLVIVLLMLAFKAWALKPEPVPVELQQEAANSELVHQGVCATPPVGKEELCMVGYDQATDTFWMLLFNDEGVLYQVVEIKGDKHRTRWIHPDLTV